MVGRDAQQVLGRDLNRVGDAVAVDAYQTDGQLSGLQIPVAPDPQGLDLVDLDPHERCNGDSIVLGASFDIERRAVDVDNQVRPVENVDGFDQSVDLSVETILFASGRLR